MKKRKMMVSILVICLLCVSMLKTVVRAETKDATVYTVTSGTEFKNAVKSAKDGDIILVLGDIQVTVDVEVGSSTKKLTVRRASANSWIVFNYINASFNNVVFDGNGINSSYSWVTSIMETTFTDCTFMNCGNGGNLSSSGCVGSAVKVQSGSCVFNDCSFENNYGLVGGNIAIQGDAQVEVNDCVIKNGGAVSNGGAIANTSATAACNITGGIITGNHASDFGGGVSNAGSMTIIGTKIYANSAVNGGADIATKTSGTTILSDTIEQLNELFSADNIEVSGWVCDYDSDTGIYIPDVDTSDKNALLKLAYAENEIETTEPSEPTAPEETQETTESETQDETHESVPEETESAAEPSSPSEIPNESAGVSTPSEPSESASTDGTSGSKEQETGTGETTVTTITYGDTISTNNSTTDNSSSRVDNSKVSSSGDSNTTTTNNTTNNYYQVSESQAAPSGSSLTAPAQGNTGFYAGTGALVTGDMLEPSGTVINRMEDISIDAQGVDCKIELIDGKYSISISVVQETADDSANDRETDIIQVIQVVLLAAIFICLVRQPKNYQA